jgi:hypothetical protein
MSCVLEHSPFHEGETMLKVRLIIAAVASLVAGGAFAQSNEIATGNMHFDAKEMDTNGDHMITREEMIAYAEKSWDTMAQGKDTIPITTAAKDFASGGVNFKARAIDIRGLCRQEIRHHEKDRQHGFRCRHGSRHRPGQHNVPAHQRRHRERPGEVVVK